MKYTITIREGNNSKTGYFESKYPLVGDEPEFTKVIKAILEMVEPPSEYEQVFKDIVMEGATNGRQEVD